ncbi:hypothetical protein ABH926_000290 [Catenulispora sp. GP43]
MKTTPTTTPTFHTCLDHLASLRRALADLEATLSAPHAHHWPTIDPTLHTGPAAWRTEKNDAATYVYGLLNEAAPLGDTHTDLVRHLQAWYQRIHETITAMTTYAERTRATYAAADEAVAAAAAAATRAAEGCVGRGLGAGGSGSLSSSGGGMP